MENTTRLKQLGKAHIDWILLGLMSVAAGTLAWLHNLHPAFIVLMLFGAWTNPLPYVFRGYEIDAFHFAGGISQRSSSAFAAVSVAVVLIGWSGIFVQVARTIQ
jgi:surface polysaccharide O-acyltransferase-like enzyme